MKTIDTAEHLKKLKDWRIVTGRLEREFRFPSFARAILFVNQIVNPIEEHQSYPQIQITYNRVTVSLFNTEAGRLTEAEFTMAAEMDGLV